MLRIFTPVKIQRVQPGLNPQTWVPEASMLTTRPPKPSIFVIRSLIFLSSKRVFLFFWILDEGRFEKRKLSCVWTSVR